MTLLLRAVAALLLLAAPAFAQTWPAKQVRIVVPFPAGGSADILCRLVGEKLSAAWGQTVIIDNRAGAGGNVGAEVVWRAEPDGYTLLCSPPGPLSINHNLYKTLPYDWSKFVAIGVLALVPNVITARPDLPQASLQELHRLRQGQSRQGDLRLAGQRLDLAPVGQHARHPGRHRAGARALQGRGPGPGRPDRQPRRHLHRQHLGSAALREEPSRRASWAWPAARAARSRRTCRRRPSSAIPTWSSSAWFALVAPPGTPDAIVQKVNADLASGAQASPNCAPASSSWAPNRKAARRPPPPPSSRTRKRAGAASSSRPM